MSDVSNQKLQKEIETLINIIQLWIPVLDQMKSMHHNLEALPNDLILLRQQLNYLIQLDHLTETQREADAGGKPHQAITSTQKSDFNNILTAQEKLQKLISSLNGTFPQLLILERKISNLVALKEKLEAIQEKNQPYASLPNYEAEFSIVCQQKNYLASPPIKKVTTKPKPPASKPPAVSNKNSQQNWILAITLSIGAMVTFSIVNMAAATANRESELNQRILELETRIEQLQQLNKRE